MPKPPRGMFQEKGRKTYAWRRMVCGVRRYEKLGREYQAACIRARQLNSEIDAGVFVPAKVTVAQAADEWLRDHVEHGRRNEHDRKTVKGRVSKYIKPQLGHLRLARLSRHNLLAFKAWLARHSISKQTCNHVLGDLRSILYWCVDAGKLAVAPIPRRFLFRLTEQRIQRLTPVETTRVRSLRGNLGFTCRLGLATGMRWSELVRARWSDVDLGNGLIRLHTTKGGRNRMVPLPAPALEEIRSRAEEIMARGGGLIPYSVNSLRSFNRDVQEHAEVPGFSSHRMRHTYACEWCDRGGNLEALQRILGHASINTTQRYARLSDEVVLREAARVNCQPIASEAQRS